MLIGSRLPGSRDHRITTDRCWLLGAGASLDAIGPNEEIGVRRCVPLTVDLTRDIQPNIVNRLKRLHRRANVPLPATDIHEALTYKLGPCIDWLKALCNERNPTTANDAILCLQDLVRHIASEIKDDQVEATLAHGGSQGFIFCAENYLWLASSCFHTPRWSVITLNYDTVLDRAFEEIGVRDPRTSQYDNWRELVEAHFAKKRMSPVHFSVQVNGVVRPILDVQKRRVA